MSPLPRKEAIELVRQRRGIDLLTRSVLLHMLDTTRDSLMLFWRSEHYLCGHFEIGERTMRRVFDRLRRSGLLLPCLWPEHLAGVRRSRARSYAIQITAEAMAKLETPGTYLSEKRSNPTKNRSRGPIREPVTVAGRTGHGGRIEPVTVAHEFERHLERERQREGDRPPPTPPPTPASENPREALRAALHVLTGGRRLDEGATEEWWSMLTGEWRVPPRGWAIEATIDWIRSKVTRLGYAREAVGLQSWWIDFDRGGVLNQASPGRRREMAGAER